MKVLALKPRFSPRLGPGPQVVIVVLIVGLFGALAIEPTRQLLEQRSRIAGMEDELYKVERSNSKLEARIDRLQDPDFLEQRARLQVGLIRPGETAYIVMPPSRGAGGKRDKAKKVDRPSPEPQSFLQGFLTFVGIP